MELQAMVESIARELIGKAAPEQAKPAAPKVLFLFCDSTAHEPFMDQFIELKNTGVEHDLLFLDGETSAWLGMHRIESGGAGRLIAMDEAAPAPLELPKQYDAIVIPEIDLDNSGRVVTGVKGSIKAEIIFSALVLEKPVLIGEDVPGIKRADRRCLERVSLPKPYAALFQRHIAAMKELGIAFAPQQRLAEALLSLLPEPAGGRQPSPAGRQGQAGEFHGKLLTANRLQPMLPLPGRSLRLAKHVIVSPLAQDILREQRIALETIE